MFVYYAFCYWNKKKIEVDTKEYLFISLTSPMGSLFPGVRGASSVIISIDNFTIAY
jgi:hypothetical protein